MKSRWHVGLSLLVCLAFSCTEKSETNETYHPIEKYIQQTRVLGLTVGKKVAIIVNTNGCHTCISQTNEMVTQVNNPNVKLIYSVANRGIIDAEVEATAHDSVTYYVDRSHTPFRKGMVKSMPVAYFLENGLMLDSVELTAKTLGKVYEFIDNKKSGR